MRDILVDGEILGSPEELPHDDLQVVTGQLAYEAVIGGDIVRRLHDGRMVLDVSRTWDFGLFYGASPEETTVPQYVIADLNSD